VVDVFDAAHAHQLAVRRVVHREADCRGSRGPAGLGHLLVPLHLGVLVDKPAVGEAPAHLRVVDPAGKQGQVIAV
jgi:hypothetical protein